MRDALKGTGYYTTGVVARRKKIASWTTPLCPGSTSPREQRRSEHVIYGPDPPERAWSPDSRWLAYTLTTKIFQKQVWLYSLAQDKSYPVTDGLAEVG